MDLSGYCGLGHTLSRTSVCLPVVHRDPPGTATSCWTISGQLGALVFLTETVANGRSMFSGIPRSCHIMVGDNYVFEKADTVWACSGSEAMK